MVRAVGGAIVARDPVARDYDFGRLRTIQNVVKAEQKPLSPLRRMWITEIGWSTASGAGQDDQGHNDRTFIYAWSRDGTDATDREAFFGVRRHNGSTKPAFVRMCRLARTNCPL